MSNRLALEQLRSIFRLLGECVELGTDPVLWRRHLAEEASELFDDCFVNLVDSPHAAESDQKRAAVAIEYVNGGYLPNKNYDLIQEFMARVEEVSPIVPAMLANVAPYQICSRRELLADRDWEFCEYYQRYVRPLGLEEQITSIDFRTPSAVSSICLLSTQHGVITEQHRAMLEVLHQELTRLRIDGRLSPVGGFSLTSLTTRQRQVLIGLMQGDSEKQLATRLGISKHTVHDHLKKLYQRMGVRSRGELCSRILKMWPALEYVAEQEH